MTVIEGSLSKWTNVMKGWQYRWFVLDDNSGLLSYYTSKEKMMRGVRRGCVRLKNAIIGIDSEDDSTFTITVDHKTFHFQARDAEERQKWVHALEDTIIRHGHSRWDLHHASSNIKDLDYRVSEADGYLQLMIEQTKKLEERIQILSDSEDKMKCEVILEHANVMLDNIKHSIVLLQIAKNTAHPINGVYHHQRPGTSNSVSSARSGLTEVMPGENVQQGIELGSECIESNHRHLLSFAPVASLIVPDTSYSSSEGEEDFFDANDAPFGGNQVPTPTSLRSFGRDSHTSVPIIPKTVPPNKNRTKSLENYANKEGLDYDALYEDDDEPDVEMESHGSVIRHLLSQVKIGMDLTKVILPTFILEKRSLLEMYADFFAHPDLFVAITDARDPRDRMVSVLKWYLSSYHAGRKSAVAKKPYNPILGEIFRCHWNLPHSSPTEQCVPDGPVPWCNGNQTTFVAEQVSHHPPISALYAEHFNKRISFNAHVYTKSKFLGLSVCVYNIGQGVISVLDYNEEYIITFPNVYGRSILTTPWIELGGSTSISCPQTGYHCNIEFITKPFYGNKKHRIMAEVLDPDKKTFLTINGEWNGVMEAKWSDKEPEVFIDVNLLDIIKKQVRPISQQEDNESRKLWKEITAGLQFNEIDKATNAKQALENKQRDEAKERKEAGLEWQTKLFKKSGEDNWLYLKPLKERLSSNASNKQEE
ncbi:oxysterol-binding protein-related protein 9 [Cylas formicarius]|uniref:oxysterol-binding protein-related protein 9 n=1 Tax=Cylas formicarius TaxID=197179 RepID=UPI002958515A|nr:oxysterol-binding protein-related protein 9 [Cylas formicarius]